MKELLLVLVIVLLVGTCAGLHQVVRVNVKDEVQLKKIQGMGLDVWSHGSLLLLGENDLMVNSTEKMVLSSMGLNTNQLLIKDVEALIEDERREIQRINAKAPSAWFDSYHNYGEIVEFASSLATNFSTLARFVPSAGKSIEGRDIPILVITSGTTTKKGSILLVGGQHAREWISPATVLYIGNKLVTEYGSSSVATQLLDNFSFVIVPTANPDGYVFTWTTTRLWRKSRRVNPNGSYGVDLNRNWGDHWCQEGGSSDPNSDTYCGTGPFSEPETQSLRSIAQQYGPFAAAIDWHSYGQLILRPYGWTNTPPSNNAKLTSVGNGLRDAIRTHSGYQYTSQAIWQLYLSAGSSADWWLNEALIPLSYGIELRDTGSNGFVLPPAQIIPTGEESYAAVTYLASQI